MRLLACATKTKGRRARAQVATTHYNGSLYELPRPVAANGLEQARVMAPERALEQQQCAAPAAAPAPPARAAERRRLALVAFGRRTN